MSYCINCGKKIHWHNKISRWLGMLTTILDNSVHFVKNTCSEDCGNLHLGELYKQYPNGNIS